MSRATEITLFLILVQASIAFVDSTGVFSASYLDVPDNNASYELVDLEEWSQEANKPQGWADVMMQSAYLVVDGLFIGVKILLTVAFVYPTLVNVFGIPSILSIFLQTGIWYTYGIWYAQYKSGKGFKTYE